MQTRRRLVVMAVLGAMALALTLTAPALAETKTTYTTDVTTGAGIQLGPGHTWGYTDGCQVGIGGGYEYRCAFEFAISIPSTAKIESATLNVRKTAGPGCGASDCPVDVYAYNGNGSSDLGDIAGGSLVRIFSPSGSVQALDVSADLQARVSNGLAWIGYRMSRDSSSTHNPDVQDFDISGTSRVSLTVTYIAQPVDVTVQLGGSGHGTVFSNIGGLSCGEFCTATFEYADLVTLTAQPQDGSLFDHWDGGECDGMTTTDCQFVVPALNMTTTAIFSSIGPPVSQPPSPTPMNLTPPPQTPAPSSKATTGPGPTGGPAPTAVPAPTDVIASDGTVITPPPATLAPGATPAPTIVGLDDTTGAGASGGLPLPVLIVLILILGAAVGSGVYWFTKRSQAT